MKLLFSILGLISSILAVILAVLPMEKIAIIPAIAALLFSAIAFYMSKNESKKLIHFVFFVTLMAIVIIAYKSIFTTDAEVITDDTFIEKTKESEEKAIEELENLDTFEELDSIN